MWITVRFGKHNGKTLPQILFSGPDWFFWAYEKNVFDKNIILQKQADDLYHKSRNIKIPKSCGVDVEVEYYLHHPTNKFSHFSVVSKEQPEHQGSSPAFRGGVIDMRVPHQIAEFDKLGCKHLLKNLKYYYLEVQALD